MKPRLWVRAKTAPSSSSVGKSDLPNVIAILSGAVLAASLILGGSSAAGLVANAMLQLLSLPLLLFVAFGSRLDVRAHRFPLVLLAAVVTLPLLQLIPLPPSLWLAL